jgi:hypothetical protein
MNTTKEHPSTWTAMRCAYEAGTSLRQQHVEAVYSDREGDVVATGNVVLLAHAGADYLTGVVTDVLERIESDPEGDASDHAHAAADACIPIPTYKQWDVFHDLYAWTEDLTELGEPAVDMTENATTAIYLIGRRLAGAVSDWVVAQEEGTEAPV